DVQALVDQMLRADFFNLSMPASCPGGVVSEASAATMSLVLEGRTQVVQDYHGNTCAPAILVQLENAIDATAGSDQWVPCEQDGCCNPMFTNPLLAGTLAASHCD